MDNDCAVLVIGGTGFVGRRVVAALVAGGHRVRCMVRDPSRAADLSADGVDVVRGDMLDAGAVSGGSGLRRRRGRRRGEHRGRLPRERGTPAAVRMVVGHGGDGFGMVERGARRRAAILLASPHQRFRTVAVDDVAHQLVALLDEPRSWTSRARSGSTSTSAATTCSLSTRWLTSPLIIWADVSRPRSTCPAACSPTSPRSSSVPRRCRPVRSAGSSGRAATRTWSVTPQPSAPCSNGRPARSTKP